MNIFLSCFKLFVLPHREYALKATNNQGMEAAMEWLLAHVDEDIPSEPKKESTIASGSDPSEPAAEDTSGDPTEGGEEAKSLKCDECNRLFKTQLEVEFHAAKSGHSKFSESTEEKKPLTEEERKEQMSKLEEKMKQKRLEREEKEKEEKLERERIRIKSGKDLTEIRRKLEEDEMKKIVEQRKREKLEEKLVRDRVKLQIEADRLARKAKDAGLPPGSNIPTPAPKPPQQEPVAKTAPKNYTQTRIQIRLTDGTAVTETFDIKEQLASVRLFIQMRQGVDIPFSMMTNFPKRVFTEEDFDKPLDVLGLVPSAVLIVTKPQP